MTFGAALLAAGCAAPIPSVRMETAMISPVQQNDNRFADERMAVSFAVFHDAIDVWVENKTNQPLKISWSQSSFIDVFGSPRGISHTNLKPAGMDSSAAYTVIPPHGHLADRLTAFSKVPPSGHRAPAEPLFSQANLDGSALSAEEFRETYRGKSFALLLMIQGDPPIPYRFRFRINETTP